jgi:vancomycin permeability regulator SanA
MQSSYKANLKNKGLVIAIVIAAALFNLFFLFYVKYQNQNLSIDNFSLGNLGNLLNLLFSTLLIIASLLYFWKNDKYINPVTVIALTAIMTFLLISAAIIEYLELPLPEWKMSRQPLVLIVKASLFCMYQVVHFVLIFILWYSFLDKDKYLLLRSFVNSLIVVMILIGFAFYFISTESMLSERYSKDDYNVGVVLGAAVWSYNKPSPSLAARVDKAIDLYKDGIIDKIQLTGSNAPGELSEAEVALRYLNEKANLNPYDIWLEKRTRSTLEQVHFIKKNLLTNEKIDNILVISDSYHLKRIQEICKFYNVKAEVFASDLKLSSQNMLYYKIRETIALLIFWFYAI